MYNLSFSRQLRRNLVVQLTDSIATRALVLRSLVFHASEVFLFLSGEKIMLTLQLSTFSNLRAANSYKRKKLRKVKATERRHRQIKEVTKTKRSTTTSRRLCDCQKNVFLLPHFSRHEGREDRSSQTRRECQI